MSATSDPGEFKATKRLFFTKVNKKVTKKRKKKALRARPQVTVLQEAITLDSEDEKAAGSILKARDDIDDITSAFSTSSSSSSSSSDESDPEPDLGTGQSSIVVPWTFGRVDFNLLNPPSSSSESDSDVDVEQ